MNALKVFNIIYGLKKIEENNLLDKVKLKRPECEFSYLLQLANNDENEKLASTIFGAVIDSISENMRELLFYEIPNRIKGSVLVFLVKEINKITQIEQSCNVLLSGKIYEYFIGRDETAISELGAYFTDRHIVDFIMKKLKPSVNEDGTIESMADMFGGSGGFTTGYINYLNENFPNKVKWETQLDKICHCDMNEDVIKSACLEFFCLTKVLPDMKENCRYTNSFSDEFRNKKFKYILTNPPYGGDKTSKSNEQTKREKVRDFIKNELLSITDEDLRLRREAQLKRIDKEEKLEKKENDKSRVCLQTCSGRVQKFAKENSLKGNDKESCSLILMMETLDIGGTCIGVLKEGVFFNKSYRDLRKCLIEKYNVREVISVPQDQFENTSTKTSIIIFDNTEEKTKEVIFSELVVERYPEDKFGEFQGDIYIVENKGDIMGVSDKLIYKAPKEEILSNPICSLNGTDYNKKEINVGEEYKLVKLGDICEFKPKSKRGASFGELTGKYNFYTSSEKIQKCDIADYNEESLIVGSGGVANIKIDNSFSCSADNLILQSKNNYYLYFMFKGNMNMLSDGFKGSTLKHISKEYLKNIQIPIPKNEEKIKEWVDKISIPYNEKNTKQNRIKELENFVQTRIKEISENEECNNVEFKNSCITKKGKQLSKEHFKSGIYPVIGGGISPTGFHNEYNFEENTILCSSSGNNAGFISKYNTKIWASDCFAIFSNYEGLTNNYLYYCLKNQQNYIFKFQNGSAQPHIYSTDLNKHIQLKIPKNKQLIQDLEPTFQEIENLHKDVKQADELYKKYIQDLSDEAIIKE
jgi:type I restriction-modification system DNA methylase subunit